MSVVYKCDRCHALAEAGTHRRIIITPPITTPDENILFDLCKECFKGLTKWLYDATQK